VKWVCIGTFAALPLQWYIVAQTQFGAVRMHQLAILAFAAVFFCRYRPRALAPLLNTVWPFVIANVFMLTVWAVIEIYHGGLTYGPVQEFMYLAVFLAMGTFIYRAAVDLEPGAVEVLRWSAAVASVAVLGGLSLSMVRNGINPVQAWSETIRSGNPEILQKELFKSAFTGFGYYEETVRGNIRHEVFGAVLCAMYVSAWAMRYRPPTGVITRAALWLSLILSALLLLVSLSRSIMIAAAVWPLLSFVRSARRYALSVRQMILAYVTLALVAVGLASGFALVLWNRFTTDTSSYQARESLYSEALSNIESHFLTGGVDTVGASSHNFILDAWLRGGILVMLSAAVILGLICLTWITLVRRMHTQPDWMVPVVAALALPVVRLGTAGGGLINPVEWVTLGFVAGVLTVHWSRRSDDSQGAATPAEAARVGAAL
jgi:hypothetical protein